MGGSRTQSYGLELDRLDRYVDIYAADGNHAWM